MSKTTRGHGTFDIIGGAIEGVQKAPVVLGVFLVSGLLTAITPTFLDTFIDDVATAIAIVLVCEALGTRLDGRQSLPIRILVGILATLIAIVPILIGLVLLVIPGIYVAARLFLVIPAAVIGGHGPFEALSTSWELMDGAVAPGIVAAIAVILLGFVVGLLALLVTGSEFVSNLLTALLIGPLTAGAQAYLYIERSENR